MSEGSCGLSEPNSRRLPRNHQKPAIFEVWGAFQAGKRELLDVGAELTSAATKSSKTRHFRGLGAFQAGKRELLDVGAELTSAATKSSKPAIFEVRAHFRPGNGSCGLSEPNSRRLPRNHQNPPFSRFGRISGRETGVAGCRSRTHVGCHEIINNRHFQGLGAFQAGKRELRDVGAELTSAATKSSKPAIFEVWGAFQAGKWELLDVGAELTSAATKSSKNRHFQGLGAFQARKRHFINLVCLQTMSFCPFTHSF
jgi:hypothetical protein